MKCEHALRNTDRVWWYVQREFEQMLDRPVADDESVTVVLVVSAMTKMLNDSTNQTLDCQGYARHSSG